MIPTHRRSMRLTNLPGRKSNPDGLSEQPCRAAASEAPTGRDGHHLTRLYRPSAVSGTGTALSADSHHLTRLHRPSAVSGTGTVLPVGGHLPTIRPQCGSSGRTRAADRCRSRAARATCPDSQRAEHAARRRPVATQSAASAPTALTSEALLDHGRPEPRQRSTISPLLQIARRQTDRCAAAVDSGIPARAV